MQLQTYADLSGVDKTVIKKPKTFFNKISKALEKKMLKTLVSLPSFGLGFFANTSYFKSVVASLF